MKRYIEKQKEEVFRYMKSVQEQGIGKERTERYNTAIKMILNLNPTKDRILDMGCREGLFLDRLVQEGFTCVWGCELIWEAAKRNKHRVALTDIHYVPFQTSTFKLVTLLHVLEHCYCPEQVIGEIKRILITEGYLYLEVPGKKNRPKADRKKLLGGQSHEFVFGEEELVGLLKDFKILSYNWKGNPNVHRLLARKKA